MMMSARSIRPALRLAAMLFALGAIASACGAMGSGGAPSSSGTGGVIGSAGTSGGAGNPATMPGNGGQTGSAGTTGAAGFTGSAGAVGAAGSTGSPDGGSPDASGAGGTGGTTGAGGAAAGSTGAAGSTTPSMCGVRYDRLIPEPQCTAPPCPYVVTPSTYHEAGPTSVVRVRASLPGFVGTVKWEWTITRPDAAPAVVSPLDASNATIDIKTDVVGDYDIVPTLVVGPKCFLSSFSVPVASPSNPSFVFRATPPTASLLPTRELIVAAAEIADVDHTVDLGAVSAGSAMSFTPLDARHVPLPSYVRVTSLAQSFDVEAYTGQGPLVANLPPELSYDVLVVPDGPWAPLLVSGPLSKVSSPDALVVSAGIAVKGEAKDANNTPIAGVRVLLREGMRPSTLGVTAADGKFSLLTRGGTLSAVISPPPGSGLSEARVAANAGFVLPADAANVTLRMQWAMVPAGTLKVTAHAPDGSPLSGARVRAESSEEIPSVGTLHVELRDPPVIDVGAAGSARADAVTDANGVADLGRLPAGPYRVTVAPPSGGALAVTSADVSVVQAGVAAVVDVKALVPLSGTLEGVDTVGGWTITAIDHGPLAPSASPQVTTHGDYKLMVSPGRPYELVVDTLAGGHTRTFVLTTGAMAPATETSGTVPGPLTWNGTITSGAHPIAGALVEVFCVGSSSPKCLDPSVSVAQGVSRADGKVTLLVPDLTP
jgi:hypothetical protein